MSESSAPGDQRTWNAVALGTDPEKGASPLQQLSSLRTGHILPIDEGHTVLLDVSVDDPFCSNMFASCISGSPCWQSYYGACVKYLPTYGSELRPSFSAAAAAAAAGVGDIMKDFTESRDAGRILNPIAWSTSIPPSIHTRCRTA